MFADHREPMVEIALQVLCVTLENEALVNQNISVDGTSTTGTAMEQATDVCSRLIFTNCCVFTHIVIVVLILLFVIACSLVTGDYTLVIQNISGLEECFNLIKTPMGYQVPKKIIIMFSNKPLIQHCNVCQKTMLMIFCTENFISISLFLPNV